jgi:2-methylcitrate dehydratase PrpD
VAGRIGTAINPRHRQLGFHTTGTVGVFGAAAACARLRGLSVEQTARALGIAGSGAGGIFEFLSDGSTSKHFHAGHAALAGLLAVDLAAGGLTGPLAIFEGDEGFLRVYGQQTDHTSLLADLGQRFELANVYFKLHAACAHCFSPIDAVLTLRQQVAAPEVERIVVGTYHAAAILDTPQPRTRAAAKFSIPYCVAAAWLEGRVSEQLFDSAYLEDPTLQALAARVEVREDPALEADFPATRAARVEATLRDGRRLERIVDLPDGMPERPASPAALEVKFSGLAEPILGPPAAAALADLALRGTDETVTTLLANAIPTDEVQIA